jgi:hypothetical protein
MAASTDQLDRQHVFSHFMLTGEGLEHEPHHHCADCDPLSIFVFTCWQAQAHNLGQLLMAVKLFLRVAA